MADGIPSPLDSKPQSDFPSSVATATAESAPAVETPPDDGGDLDQAAIDELLKSASFEDAGGSGGGSGDAGDDAGDFKLPDFQQVMRDAQASSIDLLRD